VGSNPTPSAMSVDAADLESWMDVALDEAGAAVDHGDVPVGALVVALDTGMVVARRHNERELLHDPTAHAEILALRDAAAARGSWRLDGCALVVTLEPCPMCAGAALAARIAVVAFGAADPKAGALGTLYNLGADPRLNHELEVVGGVRAAECGAHISRFFAEKRSAPTI
jgi:tRNA(adenine34) deaminase